MIAQTLKVKTEKNTWLPGMTDEVVSGSFAIFHILLSPGTASPTVWKKHMLDFFYSIALWTQLAIE